MKSPLSPYVSLLASLALHALVLGVAVGSARGAPPDTEDLEAARFIGNTFEIDALLDAADLPEHSEQAAKVEPSPAPAPEPEAAPSVEAPPPPAPPKQAPPAEASEPPPKDSPESKPALVPAAEAPSALQEVPDSVVSPEPSVARPQVAPAEVPTTSTTPVAALSAGATSAAAAAPAPSGLAPASYGQSALPPNVATLAKGFTRAVPRAASPDPIWHRLPLGDAGKAVFSIEIDAEGKVVGQGKVEQEPAPAPHLKRIIGRAVLMLKRGTFALSEAGVAAGVQRFELTAEIHQVAALDDVFAEPHDLRQIGRLVEPTRVRPGKANFTYNSGRQVELTVRMLAN